MLAIADCAGGDWPNLARDAALKISGGGQESVSLSAELLADIQQVFAVKSVSRLSTADLLAALTADDMAPWATYNRGKPMSPRQLAKRLSEYGIKPNSIRIGTATPKGFMLEDFEDVFARYLCFPVSPPDLSATPQQNGATPMFLRSAAVADNLQRCGSENLSATPNALNNITCCGVADKNPGKTEYTMEVL